ncbi:hypothetical protein [Prevotella sp. KH2C16]|uniref:hypothetical protein n=1 Tax=Prevotella sp. KH2C16 TaxID=1855325 RepID=UPI0008DFBB56|nr:hypothetical protein [Prevotella sp. KH2C16]SFF91601.1 hypothetical protein SAMN05216383_10273 [Prevotella sp. KH2C16]
MKKNIILLLAVFLFGACHESLQDRAEREAKEYTRKNCPTPVNNFQRTDSIAFDRTTNTYHYYCSFTDKLDDKTTVEKIRGQLHDGLRKGIKESTSLKAYKDAGFSFSYTCRSAKDPKTVLYEETFTAQDYQ